ncbi:MAG: choice-of-anchor J domain-containing protein [Paludibacter sp.]|nr:choice-of-anchor J domain-containing protein [Paludibacter sp.]
MKKIYFILSLAVIALLSSCSEDYNEHNFKGYKDASTPTNLTSYTYTLLDADYTTIKNAALKIAANATDSTNAKAIATNKYFQNVTPPGTLIPLLLNTKYVYADEKSVANVTYNYSAPYDTLTIVAANKYALVAPTDYAAMGTASGQPGKNNNFSSSVSPDLYIPIWLKLVKYPYAKAGDVKLIRYKYYVSSTVTNTINDVFVYDGTNWAKYKTNNPATKTFVYKGGKWLDILIYKGLTSGFGDFTTYSVKGTPVWAWDAVYTCAKMSGYLVTNLENEDWLISPQIDLTTKSAATLTFNHTGKYFGTTTNEATLWVSENYTTGDPSAATWTQVTIPNYMPNADYVFVYSGLINLKSYVGKKITLGFKYLSSTAAAGTWEVQNVTVTEE